MEPAPSAAERRERRVAWLVVAAIAAALTVAFTEPYGILNQATYLLDPLHRAMPELFHRDWLLTEAPYLPSFGWLAQWLYVADPEGPVALLAANFAVTFATYLALYWLVTAVCPGARGFAIVASWVTVTMGRALGGSYLLAGYLQPSSLATLGWVVAMAALVRGRYRACGIALAAAGAMHVNFLVLGIGLFTLAALVRRDVRREVRLRDIAWLVGPQLVVLAWFLPGLLAAAGPTGQALRILVQFHAPGHYLGSRLTARLPELASWQLAGFAALPPVAQRGRELRALWRFSVVAFVVAAGAAELVRLPAFESLTQAFWPRVAPFGQLACQVLIVAAMLRRGIVPSVASASAPGAPASVARRAWLVATVAAALVLSGRFLRWPWEATALAIAAVIAVVIVAPAVPPRLAGRAATVLAGLAVAAALWASPRGAGMTTLPYAGPSELALYRWVRAATPIDALFVAPPSLSLFRLIGRRAIIADTKSPPLQPALMVRWYQRLCAMVERGDVATHEEVERLWNELPPDALERVARAFGAEYVVAWANKPLHRAPVYINAEYAVYRVSP